MTGGGRRMVDGGDHQIDRGASRKSGSHFTAIRETTRRKDASRREIQKSVPRIEKGALCAAV